ncbi:MAG: hypothetical protein QOE01_3345, partial [Actinomycetota bacterium]|nr:hypothetical protein [Actinomycetota bacterium]
VAIVISNTNAFKVAGNLAGQTATAVPAGRKQRIVKLSAKPFTVAAGRKTTVKLKLPAALQQLLKRKGRLTLRLRATVRDPAGRRRSVTRTLSPRRARPATRTFP